MNKYDVIVIGSGLGGLECGYIMAKRGYRVCVLEQGSQTGGCLQTFKRGKTLFDTGFHFIGGLDETQFLYRLFRYYDLHDLPWHRLDDHAFAEVIIDDKQFLLASGYERYAERLARYFPHQRKELFQFTNYLRTIANSVEGSFDTDKEREAGTSSYFDHSAYEYLTKTFSDPLLIDVLSATSLTMELYPEQTPLYVFAQTNNSFLRSAWRIKGGGSLISDRLIENIRRMGGEVITKAKVTRLLEKEGRINRVEVNGQEMLEADYVISNIHPTSTLNLIPESTMVRKVFRNRITKLQNTFGMFTTHLKLKPQAVPYLNRSIFYYTEPGVWHANLKPNPTPKSILINYQYPTDGSIYTDNIDILTPMHWEEVAKWEHTTVGKRGEDYKEFKAKRADQCIELAMRCVPELRGNIEQVYTSTPLTYRDYTGTHQGTAYGIRKDYNNILMTVLTPQTPIPNLYFTGQNLNMHGILGVSTSAFITCAKIVGLEPLLQDIEQSKI